MSIPEYIKALCQEDGWEDVLPLRKFVNEDGEAMTAEAVAMFALARELAKLTKATTREKQLEKALQKLIDADVGSEQDKIVAKKNAARLVSKR